MIWKDGRKLRSDKENITGYFDLLYFIYNWVAVSKIESRQEMYIRFSDRPVPTLEN